MAIEIAALTTPAERETAVRKALSEIEKEHGKGTIFGMNEKVGIPIPSIPTGIYGLDYKVLGVGGMPRGRIVEIFGPEASGKTTISLVTVAAAQRAGGLAAYIDVEHSLDPTWMALMGVDVNALLVSQPDYGEQALQVVETLLESKAFDIIVVDSVAALVPKAELDGEIGDASIGVQARMMSQACRKLAGKVRTANTCLAFINQIREKIGVMFGSPETTSGGRALKFYSSVRLDIRKTQALKDGDVVIGNQVKIKCVKNKVAPPFRETTVDLLYDRGFNFNASLFDAAVAAGVVEKSGSWYSRGGERLGQGRDAAIAFLDDPKVAAQVLKEVRQQEEAE